MPTILLKPSSYYLCPSAGPDPDAILESVVNMQTLPAAHWGVCQ